MDTIVYIDGFNLYYCALKGTPHKWLDVVEMSRRLLPQDNIVKVRYFTARVKPRPDDPRVHERQALYLRAIKSNPLVEVHEGHYREDKKWVPLAKGPWSTMTRPPVKFPKLVDRLQKIVEKRNGRVPLVKVLRSEEKGSDVNLGAHLLRDVYTGGCAKALVITNDADLALPITFAVDHGATVGVVTPNSAGQVNTRLRNIATFNLSLWPSVVASCQLANPTIDQRGRQIHKPNRW